MPADQPWFLIPEFIGLFVGMFACWLTTTLYILWNLRQSRRQQLWLLHQNLAQINLSWSRTEASLKPADSVDFSGEGLREQKWFLLAGAVLSVASWLGFFILCILILSLERLATPRLERAIFKTALVQKKLTPAVVQQIINELIPK